MTATKNENLDDHELILNVWLQWKCRECGRKKDTEEGEEWPMCCGHTMRLQPVKNLTLMNK